MMLEEKSQTPAKPSPYCSCDAPESVEGYEGWMGCGVVGYMKREGTK